ncbi:MAG: S8 family serine peptidase [Bacteroidota bacterium]
MKRLFILLALQGILSPFLMGQTYFWAGDEKVALSKDLQSAVVLYQAPLDAQARLRRTPHIKRQLIQCQTGEHIVDAIQRAGIETQAVKSISQGLRTPEGILLWPTQKVLYQLTPQASTEEVELLLSPYPNSRLGTTIGGFPYIELSTTDHALDVANLLKESGLVSYAIPDFLFSAQAASPTMAPDQIQTCGASDSLYDFQYYLNNTDDLPNFSPTYPFNRSKVDIDIDAPEAWCTTKGDSNIIVAVVDVGVEDHVDLFNDKTGTSRVLPGASMADTVLSPTGGPISDPDNPQAHGVAIAGIIAASHNSIGVAGIAPEVKILPIHISLTLSAVSEAADAINYAWKNGADIINNSWAADFCTSNDAFFPPVLAAIDSALTFGREGKGCVVVYASGIIDASNTSTCVRYPASISSVLTVSAMDALGDRPTYAPYGPEVDIAAPSNPSAFSNVSSLDRMGNNGYNTDTTTFNGDYTDRNYTRWFGGTSTASAQISGIAALILSVNPELTQTDITSFIKQSATPMTNDTFGFFGDGRANAQGAVNLALTSFPIEWAYVEGEVVDSRIRLFWGTSQEENTDRFVVERENSGVFEQLATITAAGDSQTLKEYEWFDNSPRRGQNIYRLKQEDIDGKFSYSSLVEVFYAPERTFFTPSSFSGSGQIIPVEVINKANQILDYTLLDLQGRQVAYGLLRPDRRSFQVDLQIPFVAPGVYVLKIGQGFLWSENTRIVALP